VTSAVAETAGSGAPFLARIGTRLGSRPRLAALCLGALSALALPPVHLLPLLLGFAGLAHLVLAAPRPRRAMAIGWCFGFGHFLVGLHWVAIAFLVDVERYGALALPAVLLLAAGLGLFAAAAAFLVALRRWRSPAAGALALALAWSATELLRGEIGGFPWNLTGQALAFSALLLQPAALVGAYGLSLLVLVAATLPASLLREGGARRQPPLLAALLALTLLGHGAWRLAEAEGGEVDGVRLRLVQANVAQFHKWDPELVARWFDRHLALSADGADGVTHVIWPESATPYQLERDPTAREMIARVVPPGGLLLTGGDRLDLDGPTPAASNSLFALDDQGTILDRYDKVDLVPFGEYLPFRPLLGRIGLGSLIGGTIDFEPGPGRRTLALPGLPPFSPLICYEAIFPGRAIDPAARPAWLLNITNDGWFGRSAGPYQHLAMARLRAVEEGLPLLRAANTGISAVIDAHGRVRARLGLDRMGVIDSALPAALANPPPYARFGRLALALVVLALASVAVLVELRKKHTGA
jgi:apolipoprotein N-acyltransferase